ncbi:hypothetical protein PR048_017372 [Dryococelus australis]|uniref:Integrase catalytic domain-containing protein n=1 Tax=Dryococelus australis TaxID=614101 RepID=A0ABQ9H9C7_9NEOP|nr:hypothetical protein PR048_017372 [Dryococelus australis]
MLTVIDCFSKYAWASPVSRKCDLDIGNTLKTILQNKGSPENLQMYLGTFRSLMAANKINHYSTYSRLKASIVEQFNRTLDIEMWREFSSWESYKWRDLLPRLVTSYNR